MSTKKRSRLRPNPNLSNHIIYKNFRAKWRRTHRLNELDMFNTHTFDPAQFFRPLELASEENLSITSACTFYRAIGRSCPSAELLLLRTREEGAERMEIHMNHALEKQFLDLPSKIRRQFKKIGTVIIDFHVDPYYGAVDNPHIVRCPPKHSTTCGYSYLTAELYSPQGKQTIAVLPRHPGEVLEDIFRDLLTRVEFLLSPKLLLMDGEFATVKIMEGLQHRGIPFVARKSITSRIQPLALAYSLTDGWEELRKFHEVTLLDKTKTYETTVHITFQRVNSQMKALAISPALQLTPEEADQVYKRRFNIETDYRDTHAFQARTTSKDLAVRLLLFLFALMLWNLWRAFLLLAPDGSKGSLNQVARWRRQLRTIRLLSLRDELL